MLATTLIYAITLKRGDCLDKRFLSSDRDIRGKRRAKLSTESDNQHQANYNKPTIHQIFDQFMNIKRSEGVSQRRIDTLIQNKEYFVNFLKSKGYSELMDDITTSVIREWIVDMQEQYVVYQKHVRGGKRKGLAPKTINGRVKDIKHFFNVAVENGLIERNEASPIKLLKEPIDTVAGLSEKQVKQLLKACDQKSYTGFRDYVYCLLVLDTGLRAGEMLSLRVKHFDFDIATVKVDEEIAKNRKSRIIPVSRKVLNLVQRLFYENKLSFGSDYLFMTAYGERMTSKGVVRQFATLRKNAGLDGVKVTSHVLRHTFAKMCVQNGMDPFTLQLLLGHSRMDIVRLYVQMNATDLLESHKKFSPVTKFRI